MNKQKYRILFSSFVALLITSILSVGVAYAWFPSLFDIASQNQNPGTLDANANYSYWDKASLNTNKWTTISAETPLTLNLGEMVRIDQLPSGTENYFRFNFSESADVSYHYQVVLETLAIIVDTNVGVVSLPEVNYYSADPSQKAYNYYYFLSTSDILDPTLVFANPSSMTSYQVTSLDQNLVGAYLEETTYLYVMFDLRLKEIQNIIDRIPVSYSPYSLEFAFNFLIEKRTIDEI